MTNDLVKQCESRSCRNTFVLGETGVQALDGTMLCDYCAGVVRSHSGFIAYHMMREEDRIRLQGRDQALYSEAAVSLGKAR